MSINSRQLSAHSQQSSANRAQVLLRFGVLLIVSYGLLTNNATSSVVLPIAEHKRITAGISATSMNRLAVVNDRIAQIFGDEGTFVTQADDQTGQLFIKPTPENGTTPLSLTLITENGITQDLTLKITEKTPSTIILKGSVLSKDQQAEEVLDKGLPIQENLISLVKRAILGQLPSLDLIPDTRPVPAGCTIRHQRSYHAGSALVHVYDIENGSDEDLVELQDHQLTQPGDLAVCIRDALLGPQTSTQLYVVQRSVIRSQESDK